MDWIKNNIAFLGNRRTVLPDMKLEHQRALKLIRNFHPVGNQFVYALSYLNNEVLSLTGNIHRMLGYEAREVNDVDFFYSRIHPDDLDSVKSLTLKAISACTGENRLVPMEQVFHFIYRIRRKDGNYILVQRQSGLLTKDANHDMITSFGIYTDVSHLTNSQEVHAHMSGPTIPEFRFSEPSSPGKAKFTQRERQVISLLAEGMSSKQIANELFISKETVSTHRKNILRKSGTTNSSGLMAYIFKNGL